MKFNSHFYVFNYHSIRILILEFLHTVWFPWKLRTSGQIPNFRSSWSPTFELNIFDLGQIWLELEWYSKTPSIFRAVPFFWSSNSNDNVLKPLL